MKRKNSNKSSQLPKLEKTVAELERRLRVANSSLNSVPVGFNRKKENAKSEIRDEESHGLVEEEKQNLIADMDFEVLLFQQTNFFFFKGKNLN